MRKLSHKISIHAPTRGATKLFFLLRQFPKNFNPRSHERSDAETLQRGASTAISIHAPTRGATKIFLILRGLTLRFQSTLPREERRKLSSCRMFPPALFQSTLPREERRNAAAYDSLTGEFQSTLPREERR